MRLARPGISVSLAAAVLISIPSTSGADQVVSLSPEVTIGWRAAPQAATQPLVEVNGVPPQALRQLERTNWTVPQWQALLPVYVEQSDADAESEFLPMAGDYNIREGVLTFTPAFPLEPGLTYRAVFHPSNLPGITLSHSQSSSSTHRLSASPARGPTVVTHVYPTSAVVPENLLKFYLHFSAPMRRGHVYDFIHLRNAAGTNVELPFLELDEELWDPTMTRLTLFFDPARIKRGVRPLEEIGPSLEAGQRYTLVINHQWQDAAGNPLGADFEKSFTVTQPDRKPLDLAQWQIAPPRGGTRDVLTVNFGKPLDHALAQRLIHVTDIAGRGVPGRTEIREEERRWLFVPEQPWKPTEYVLLIATALEDIAGNNIGKPFEVDLFETVTRRLTNTVEKLKFRVL